MTSRPAKCDYCDKPARFLCDYVVFGNRLDGNKTCDRPLCEDHRRNKASGFACRRGKGGGCSLLSLDYCPRHDTRERVGG